MILEDRFIELLEYNPPLTKKKDFNSFWDDTLEISLNVPLRAKKRRINYPSPFVTVHDVSYCGYDDTRIKGWFITPKFTSGEKLPVLITYPAFGYGRGKPADYMQWVTMGLCVLAVDTRLHGGDSGNDMFFTNGLIGNVSTLGILEKNEYYYRAVYVDAIKAIDLASSFREVNSKKIIVHGIEQGGGIAMAVCALDKRPRLGLFNVPTLCDLESRLLSPAGNVNGITDYLLRNPLRYQQVLDTLSYFDVMNFASEITCEVFASVALKSSESPAINFFAAYNQVNSIKQVEIYPFNGDDGAIDLHQEKEMNHLRNTGIIEFE